MYRRPPRSKLSSSSAASKVYKRQKSGSSEGYVDRINPKNKDTSGNGDTFIFNSPRPIDEIEAAKQMKKTKQDMAEGF